MRPWISTRSITRAWRVLAVIGNLLYPTFTPWVRAACGRNFSGRSPHPGTCRGGKRDRALRHLIAQIHQRVLVQILHVGVQFVGVVRERSEASRLAELTTVIIRGADHGAVFQGQLRF